MVSYQRSPSCSEELSALVVGAEADIRYKSAKLLILAMFVAQVATELALVATVVTSPALGTKRWKA